MSIRSILAEVAASLGFKRGAQFLADDVVIASEHLPAVVHSFALNRRSRTKLAHDNLAGALEDLETSRRRLADIDNPGVRAIVEDDINLLVGEVLTEAQPVRAAELLEVVDHNFVARGQAAMSVLAKSALASAQSRLGRDDEANATLERALGALEAQASALSTPEQKLGFANQTRDVLDRLIVLRALRLGDPLGALDVLDRYRNLFVDRDPVSERDVAPRVTDGNRSREAGTRVLLYRVLADRTLVWVAAPNAIRMRQLRADRDQLEAAAHRLQAAAAAQHSAAIRTELAWLYNALIAPLRDLLVGGNDLRVVPDRMLYQVPFGALLDEATGEFLIEHGTVIVAPHSTLEASFGEPPPREAASVLVVADPTLSPDLAGRLGRLPNAREGAQRIASLYRRHTSLLGPDARLARVQAELTGHDVVHFAVHATPAAHDGAGASLVLAGRPDAEHSGMSASTIAGIRIDQHPVVVLAACDSVGGLLGANAGAASLAWSFLRAGASSVVASLWQVQDEYTEALMYEFHQRLAGGVTPGEALRLAQLTLLRNNDDPSAGLAQWAAFEVFLPWAL